MTIIEIAGKGVVPDLSVASAANDLNADERPLPLCPSSSAVLIPELYIQKVVARLSSSQAGSRKDRRERAPRIKENPKTSKHNDTRSQAQNLVAATRTEGSSLNAFATKAVAKLSSKNSEKGRQSRARKSKVKDTRGCANSVAAAKTACLMEECRTVKGGSRIDPLCQHNKATESQTSQRSESHTREWQNTVTCDRGLIEKLKLRALLDAVSSAGRRENEEGHSDEVISERLASVRIQRTLARNDDKPTARSEDALKTGLRAYENYEQTNNNAIASFALRKAEQMQDALASREFEAKYRDVLGLDHHLFFATMDVKDTLRRDTTDGLLSCREGCCHSSSIARPEKDDKSTRFIPLPPFCLPHHYETYI